jgi:hypothetical protein
MIKSRFLFAIVFTAISVYSFAQKAENVITELEVMRIETILSADDMQGRRPGTPGIEKAADFICSEFSKIGLKPLGQSKSFKQCFAIIRPKQTSMEALLNNVVLEIKDVAVFTASPMLQVTAQSGYKKVYIKPGANLIREAQQIIGGTENTIVLVDTSFARTFPVLQRLKCTLMKNPANFVFLLTREEPTAYAITVRHEIEEQQFSNVVGVIPGKSKKKEYVIFSGHYDHLGIGKPVNGDSIFNGANDDAAGTTAVIMLAKYYKALRNNDRTLIFSAFTAEEIGGFGAQYFSKQLPAEQVMAMFNIEMIGTESKWGKNSAYITGYEKTDMGQILTKNLQGTAFTFHPDPYPKEQLFYRSDNATLARLGVPAHTISTSKMDNEPNYHKVTDEIGTLDISNMTEIIKAIAKSAVSIVNGTDMPSRVNADDLR